MNPREMQKAFMQQLDAVDIPAVPSEDFEYYINRAIDKFINQRFEMRNNRQQLGFEQSQIRVDDLRDLITESNPIDTLTLNVPFSDDFFIDYGVLPSDYMHLLHTSAKVFFNRTGINFTTTANKRNPDGILNTDYAEKNVQCSFSQLDDIQSVLTDPFHTTKIVDPTYTVNDDKIYTYTNKNFIVDKVYVSYIRQPAKVSLSTDTSCDLAESTHEDIVELAVQLIARDRGAKQAPIESDDSE